MNKTIKEQWESDEMTIEAYSILNHIDKVFMEDMVVAEIGVYKAETSVCFLKNLNVKKYYAIDPWGYLADNSEESNTKRCVESGEAEKCARETLEQYSDVVEIIKKPSRDAVELIPDNSLDFIFIDGDHDIDAVYDDIKLYYPKVKVGGIIAGDDYHWSTSCKHCKSNIKPVKMAIDKYIKDFLTSIQGVMEWRGDYRSWYFIKDRSNIYHWQILPKKEEL